MTIGRPTHAAPADGAAAAAAPVDINADFISLRNLRDAVAKELKVDPATLELSMGMSHDFDRAVRPLPPPPATPM